MAATTRSLEAMDVLDGADLGVVEMLRGLGPREVRSRDLPVVRRETLTWSGGTGGRPLVVRFEAENRGDRPTRPVTAGIGVAAFGAFVPSRVVAHVAIPSLAPGATARPVAVLRSSDLPAAPAGAGTIGGWPGSRPSPRVLGFAARILADRTSGERVRWAGNLDVWMDERPRVERHRTQVRLARGSMNRVMAHVYAHDGDAVAFETTAPAGWGVDLELDGVAVEAGTWYAVREEGLLWAAIRPADDSEPAGEVVVGVRRRSDDRVVPIEFQIAC